jgi:transposase
MARVDILTGVERQRRRSDNEQLSILREAFRPGAVVAAVARSHDIRAQQIYHWRKRFAAFNEAPVFLPVSMIDDGVPDITEVKQGVVSPQPMATLPIEISLRNGRILKVPAAMDRSVLSSLIACVEAA